MNDKKGKKMERGGWIMDKIKLKAILGIIIDIGSYN